MAESVVEVDLEFGVGVLWWSLPALALRGRGTRAG